MQSQQLIYSHLSSLKTIPLNHSLDEIRELKKKKIGCLWLWQKMSIIMIKICCIAAYIYIYKYMQNIINNNDKLQGMNEHTSLYIYLSHFILERVDVGCVWEMSLRREQTATYWPKVLLTIAALFPHLGWGCSTVGHWGSQALSLQADSHAGILFPNRLQLQLEMELTQAVCGTWLYNCLTSTCFCLFTQVHLLIDGSVEGQYITNYHYLDLIISRVWDKISRLTEVLVIHRIVQINFVNS